MRSVTVLLVLVLSSVSSFTPTLPTTIRCSNTPCLAQKRSDNDCNPSSPVQSRRDVLLVASLAVISTSSLPSLPANAATRPPLEDLLYKILRVREATQQETRLINSGKFKDVQRANVKLAVKFMLENYRLADQFVQASTYIEDASRRLEAAQVGQSAVQNLYTILEYFDSSDVENIKVGQNSMTGKEAIVLKGLEATKQSIDSFIAYFPQADVDEQRQKIKSENELNIKEFDSSLGGIVNLPNP